LIDKFRNNDCEGFFGVYDGHGGETASKYTSEVLHKV
jgi:serine/threonine protein phosphatase PrpC